MLAIVALAATAPGAWAAGSWFELGTGASPVNHDSAQNATTPSLAAVVGQVDQGAVYLGWKEIAAVSGSGNVDQARAATLASTPFEAHPWNEVLSAGQFSLNLDSGHEATQVHLAVVGGTLYAAWIEDADIHVQSWNGSSWNDLADTTPVNSVTPFELSLLNVGGNLWIAWTEASGPHRLVFVKKYDGSLWSSVGSGSLNFSASGVAHDPQLAVDGSGTPFVAWSEDSKIRVSHFTSGAWSLLGSGASPISTAADDAEHPSITDVNLTPYVAWYEDDTSVSPATERVRVKQWDGTTWNTVGGSFVNRDGAAQARDPSLAGERTPYIAWVEKPIGGTAFQLQTAQFDGTTWQSLGPPLNHDASFDAKSPNLFDNYTYCDGCGGFFDTPVVAWSETDAHGHDQIRAAAFGTPPQNTARPDISGTPQNGNQLSCTHGTWTGNPTSFTVLWDRGLHSATTDNDPSWHAIDGATGDTYTVQPGDDGSRVRCRVVASNGIVSAEAVSQSLRTDAGAPYNDSPSGQPTITGDVTARSILTCNPGGPMSSQIGVPGWHNAPDFTYQWIRNGQAIPGATHQTYQTTIYRIGSQVIDQNGDGDHLIGCRVRGVNDIGSSGEYPAPGVHVVDNTPRNYQAPNVQVIRDSTSDPDPLKETLVCVPGAWYDDYGQYATQWLRNGAPVAGAVTSRYRPVQADYGRRLACQVTATNPAGPSSPALSGPVLIALPVGVADIQIYREGGTNPVDPTNMLPVTERYRDAIKAVVISRLKQGIDNATAACQLVIRRRGWPQSAPNPTSIGKFHTITEEDRCRILLYAPQRVQPYFDGAVRYLNGRCTAVPAAVSSQFYLCHSLGIQIAPIDPLRPPAQDTALLAAIAPATPAAIYWDLDHNASTDAVCPGSAPVVRTIFPSGRWHPRVVIVDEDGTVHSGDISFPLYNHPLSGGRLRSGEVRVCGTSLDPPPTPQLPCVTAGTIGGIQITNANLCPIDARQINNADFSQLLTADLKQYLLRVSEQQLANSGDAVTAAARPDGGPAQTVYAPWSSTPQAAGDIAVKARRPGTAPDISLSDQFVNSRIIAGALANTAASVTSESSPGNYDKLALSTKYLSGSALAAHPDWIKFALNRPKEGFAYDQIYVARGASRGSGGAADASSAAAGDLASVLPGYSADVGSVMVDGVDMSALPDAAGPTAELLVPSDVNSALPNVHSMSLVGRNVVSSMGLPTDPAAVPLAVAGQLKQEFNDQVNAVKGQVIQQANLEVQSFENQAKDLASAQRDQLLAAVKKQLNLGPFDLAGDVDVRANEDGTATIHASAALPGLTGLDGSKLQVDVTINGDLQGHLHLQGIHLHAGKAFLFGINLSDLDLSYDGQTGLDVKGTMLFPQLANAGVKINDFKLGPNGSVQKLDLSYLAGAGQGLPIGYGVFITAVRALIDLQNSNFGAGLTFSFGPSIGGGCPPVGIVASLQVHMAHQFSMDGEGDVVIACVQVGQLHFHADEGGYISLVGHAGFDLGPISIHADIGAAFDYPRWEVYVDATGAIHPIIEDVEVHAVVSNAGVAGCGTIKIDIPIVGSLIKAITGHRSINLSAGASVDFTNGRPPLSVGELVKNLSLFTGCDIGHYYTLPHITASDAQAGSTSFRIPPGTGPTLISLEGAGQAPRVRLRSPSGQVLDFTDATVPGGKRLPSGQWGIVLASEDRTVVILPRPQAGLWTADVAPGSADVVRVRRAPILPPVAFKAHGSGRGIHRALSYTIAPEAGQTVTFTETARGESKVLRRIKGGGNGRILYTVGEARSRRRQVLAEVFQDGQLRQHRIVANYSAPNVRVGKVRNLRVRRVGRNAVITWARSALAHSYVVQVKYGTGKLLLLSPRPGSRRVVVRHVRRGEGLIVKVLVFSNAGRRGPLATVRLKGSMLVGATHKLPPYKPPKHRRKKK